MEARLVIEIGVTFVKQLEITYNSDILIGMHGSGLTHLLFLPDWATVFEIYNCDDALCYSDLARLRGIKYFTWKNLEKIQQVGRGVSPNTNNENKKFANYRFDRTEFRRLINQV
ncbi:unnamed protein product [Dracunculus medinensis]|uniref:Glycosyltransferase family 61 protein n=1 Tax=Dracunculus medinensis TaxID=318479 RepID=A0A0N4U5G1_DRAME|nr:unnamed protein product [Dracunculus medinensis]